MKWVNEYGAFLGWGLMKDIFCPFREQKKPTGMLASKLRIWISLFTVGLRCKRLTVTRFW